jgi:hypothetical protein
VKEPSPKEEAQHALLTLKELVAKPILTALDRKTAGTYLDHALEMVKLLTVARPRKGKA